MAFHSITYLFFFLTATVGVLHALPQRFRKAFLIFASLAFYAWGAPGFMWVFVISLAVDFALLRGLAIAKGQGRKAMLGLFVLTNLAVLVYYKYSGFIVGEISRMASMFGVGSLPLADIVWPLGISFFTFHKISYALDLYSNKEEDSGGYWDYVAYIVMFPKILMGPIVRFSNLYPFSFSPTYEVFLKGANRFIVGLAKKVLLADVLARVANQAFEMEAASLPPMYAWVGALCFTLQIYFDFSGYTDMALGTGQMMGLELPENFKRPYLARSFTEFWRRWHITLSAWFKEYLYVPLGGNRCSRARNIMNLWVVFLVSGLWHGANWTFIVWGAYHGFFMMLDKLRYWRAGEKHRGLLSHLGTFILLIIGWVIFRSDSIHHAYQYLLRMADIPSLSSIDMNLLPVELATNRERFTLALGLLLCLLPERYSIRLEDAFYGNRGRSMLPEAVSGCLTVMLFVLALSDILNRDFFPYLYLRF